MSSFDGTTFKVVIPDQDDSYPRPEWQSPAWRLSLRALVTSNANMRALINGVSEVDLELIYGTMNCFGHVKGGIGKKELIVPRSRGVLITYDSAFLTGLAHVAHARAPEKYLVDLVFVIESDITP